MKKRVLIIGFFFLSTLSYSAGFLSYTASMLIECQDQDQKTKYEERKDWINDRKNGLLTLCNELF